MNWQRILLFVALVLFGLVSLRSLEANERSELRAAVRSEIKAMPITERPNRVGHFYGNTVRRRFHARHDW